MLKVNRVDASIYAEAWSKLSGFLGRSDFVSNHEIDVSRQIAELSPELKVAVSELIALLKQKQETLGPDELAGILTAACRVIPFSYPLRLYVSQICQIHPQHASVEMNSVAGRADDLVTKNYRVSLAELLAEIENHCSDLLHTAKYQGIAVWPVMRAALATVVENWRLEQGRFTTRAAKDAESVLENIENALSSGVKYSAPKIRFFEDGPDNQAGSRDVEFLFFARALRYMKKKDGNWIDGPFDYLHQLLAPNYSCLKIEEFDEQALKRQPRTLSPEYFSTPWEHNKKKFLTKMNPVIPSWSGQDERNSWELYSAASAILGLDGGRKTYLGILNTLKYASGYAAYFRKLLRSINPKFVFQEFYYSPESTGLILACKSMKIPVIEVQHGLIGSHQWLSTHWLHMPKDGYNSHPDYFWVFDQFEKENSEAFLTNQATARPACVCGLSELELLRRSGRKYEKGEKTGHDELGTEFMEGTYNVLFSVQYDATDFSPVVALSKALPPDARVFVRLHPMQVPLIDRIKELFEDYGLQNVEVELSTKVPLYELMEKCQHVVTKYSTLAREALEFDCDVTLIDPMGKQLFHQYVDLGRMEYCSTNDELVDTVLMAHRKFKTPENWQKKTLQFDQFRQSYLRTSPEAAIDELVVDWRSKVQRANRVARNLNASNLFAKPLDIDRCAPRDKIPHVKRSSGDFSSRRLFVVDQSVPINRNALSLLFVHLLTEVDEATAVDLLFQGESAAHNSVEILQLFFGMSKRPINVHIDKEALPQDGAVQDVVHISELFLERYRGTELAIPESCRTRISASDDTISQTKQWLMSKALSANPNVLTFGEDLSPQTVSRILKSGWLTEFSAKKNMIVNGSRHFLDATLEVREPLVVFEPGSFAFDAAVSLCQCADVNILISDFAGEQLYAGAGRTSIVLPAHLGLSSDFGEVAVHFEHAVNSAG